MKKTLLAHLLPLLMLATVQVLPAQELTYYVSPRGNDKHAGTEARPFKTLRHALWAARSAQSNEAQPVRIVMGGGEYPMDDVIKVDSMQNVSIVAAEGQRPILSGDAVLSGWKPVTDSKVLQRIPAEARGKVWQASLGKAGVRDAGNVIGTENRFDLYYNGQRLHPSRWPNTGFTRSGKAMGATPRGKNYANYKGTKEGIFQYQDARIDRWAQEQDAYMHGYWFWDWAEEPKQVVGINPDSRTVTLATPHHGYGYRDGFRYYGLNLLCELDTLGEYYIDRSAGMVYLYEPEGFNPKGGQVSASVYSDDYMIRMDNSRNITVQGLTLRGGRQGAMSVKDCEDVMVKDCVIERFGNTLIRWDGGKNYTLTGCLLQQMGHGGIWAQGGDRKTLTPANYVVEQTIFSDISLYKPTYQPAILFQGAGMQIRHNLFQRCASSALRLECNDVLVEYNHFKQLVRESDDQGGTDAHYDPTFRGTVIRYNYWKDIVGATREGAAAVRLDDLISGYKIYGNVFDNCGGGYFGAVQIHGGNETLVENNLMYRCNKTVSMSKWSPERRREEHYTYPMLKRMAAVDFPSKLYKERYPELNTDEDITVHPNRNYVLHNLSINPRKKLPTDEKEYVIEGNTELEDSDKPLEYFLQPDVLRGYGLKAIPFSEMGVTRNRYLEQVVE